MKIPLSWLKDYVEIDRPVYQLAEKMTLAGLEVTKTERIGEWWDREKIVVGEVLHVEKHPNADRLLLADVNYGAEAPLRVVTGAPNLFPYIGNAAARPKVVFATVGAVLIDGYDPARRRKRLKASKIRGIPSVGMVCSERELGLSDEHTGIIILPDDAPVGTPLSDYLGDTVLDIDITPNMARCLSMTGVAREVHALLETDLHIQQPQVTPAGLPYTVDDKVQVVIEAKDLCYRYTATLLENVTIGPAPFWMARRLSLAGMRPINNVVDITNYVMLEWGQPLHAFDYDKLVERAGGEKPTISVRRARPGEKMRTLDGVERTLTEETLLICDTAGPIAIAGVMGGEETEVTAESRNVLLESATFAYINNRRTAQALKLPSEASYRFSRGIPAEMAPHAARRAAALMVDLAGAQVVPGLADNYPVKQVPRVVEVTPARIQALLGAEIASTAMVDILHRLDFGVAYDEPLTPDTLLRCTVPWHRLDVSIPADLVEEIARIWGADRLPERLLPAVLPPQRHNWVLETEEFLRDLLVGAGLQDIIPYPLTSLENCGKLLPEGPAPRAENYIRLANPLTPERAVMRQTLLVSLLETVQYNLRFSSRLALFEIGRIYRPRPEGRPLEQRRLGIILTGPRRQAAFGLEEGEPFAFSDLKGLLELIFQRLGMDSVTYRPERYPSLGSQAAEISQGDTVIGRAGALHPLVREAFGLPRDAVLVAEIDLGPLVAAFRQPLQWQPISAFPPIVEDLALVVDAKLLAGDVEAVLRSAGAPLLRHVELFDVYEGEGVPPGKKSLAFHLTFQSMERTLKDKDSAKLRQKILRQLKKRLGAELRA